MITHTKVILIPVIYFGTELGEIMFTKGLTNEYHEECLLNAENAVSENQHQF